MENNLTFTVERMNPGTIGQDLAECGWGGAKICIYAE